MQYIKMSHLERNCNSINHCVMVLWGSSFLKIVLTDILLHLFKSFFKIHF